jgi:nitroreductase
MDTIEAIFTRRSIRRYKPQAVPENLVRELLEAAMFAPSANNFQPWQFVVIDDRGLLDKIPSVHPYSQMLKEAPMAILVCGDTRKQELEGYLAVDCAAATQNILLAAHAEGLGAVWLGVFPREERMRGLHRLLALPDYIVPITLIGVGYPNESKPRPERYDGSKIHRNKW